jgi:hypothetical protein
MTFNGPEQADYGNLLPLNRRFLELLGNEKSLRRSLFELPETLRERLRNLRRTEIDRLADAPFLLVSFREHDDAHWDRILADPAGPGLFAEPPSASLQLVTAAALGWAWHLAQQNPFTLRLMSGAPLSWCEQIAELSNFELLDAYRHSGTAPAIRFAHRQELWRLLLGPGVSRRREVRRAAQFSALHTILSNPVERAAWLRAASRVRAPGLRVADENDPKE